MKSFIHGVIFDFNGTLFDDTKLHVKAWQKMIKEYFPHIEDTNKFIPQLLGKPNEVILNSLSPTTLSPEKSMNYLIRKKQCTGKNV